VALGSRANGSLSLAFLEVERHGSWVTGGAGGRERERERDPVQALREPWTEGGREGGREGERESVRIGRRRCRRHGRAREGERGREIKGVRETAAVPRISGQYYCGQCVCVRACVRALLYGENALENARASSARTKRTIVGDVGSWCTAMPVAVVSSHHWTLIFASIKCLSARLGR
jgi:hypothetical protein